MPQIRQLPPNIINQIAAGEVIERPASVVKELLENAVDSGASRIDVAVDKGGTELVRVSDNGCGIAGDQLTLAVASHATSKIHDADDLFRVRTLGFRGEALASMAEVSRLVLQSRTAEADCGTQLSVEGGRMGQPVPYGCPIGTTVEVRNLFLNTPVRRKFLRATQTEMGHVVEAFARVVLAHCQVHFTLRHNDKLLYDLAAVENWRERITSFFGDELGDGLIFVESWDEEVRLSGYVADPNFNRANTRMQYLFLNGRCIRDRSLQHALSEAYRGLLLTGRYPIAFLRLEMPPEAVDVNVHPAKLEVRFRDGNQIYSQLLGTLRKKFLTTDLTAKVHSRAPIADGHPATAYDPQQGENRRSQLAAWADSRFPTSTQATDLTQSPKHALPLQFTAAPRTELPLAVSSRDGAEPSVVAGGPVSERPEPPLSSSPRARTQSGARLPPASALQIHNRYLVTEDENGVVIIDQHALHERILYEQLRAKVLAGEMETQRLLVPEPVSLTAAEAATVLEARELLLPLGIEIEAFGGDTVVVSAYPAMLANLSPADMLRQLVEQLMSGGKEPDRRDLLDELLHMISCKAAIKAGDRLSPEEVTALLEHRDLCHDAHHCPHGRPTALVFTRQELDRRFKRT